MTNKIEYSNWTNQTLKNIAKQVDKDNIQGLNSTEVFDFVKAALDKNVEKDEIYKTLGVDINRKPASKSSNFAYEQDPMFDKAKEYYNTQMDYFQRCDVTSATYTKLEENLYNMEKSIDQAFIDCEAYQNIVIVPRKYYRFYPYFNDKLINFNLEEIRNLTLTDMDALHELRDKVEYIMEEANGLKTHNEPAKKDFDIEALAKKHLGMPYEEFAALYKDELEFCKTVTAADFSSMNETQRAVYSKAKAYATEMLNTTILEAHNTNWDVGERKLDETLKATDGMLLISDFEIDGITDENLSEIKSGIMYKAFESALLQTYNESNQSEIKSASTELKHKKSEKRIINGNLLIFDSDGSVYDAAGRRLK